jgi:hypothetical protein
MPSMNRIWYLPKPSSVLNVGQLTWSKKSVLLSILFACLTLETFLRLASPEVLIFIRNSRKVFQSHPVWKVDYRLNSFAHFYLRSWSGVTIYDFSIAVNEHGFRDRSRQIDEKIYPDPAKDHIHAIGDSFTQGWGLPYELSYPALLDGMFGQATQVLNLGLNGYGAIAATQKSMVLWEKFPAKHVIYLFTPNDFSDDQGALNRSSFVKNYVVPAADVVRSQLYVANLWGYFSLHYVWRAPLSMTNEVARKGRWLSPGLGHALLEIKDGEYEVVGQRPDASVYGASLEAIRVYADFLRARGAEFLIVALEADNEKVMVENEIVREFAVKNGIAFVMLRAGDEFRLNREGHLNSLGTLRLAEKIFNWIQR